MSNTDKMSKKSSSYEKQLIRSSSSCLIGEFLSIHGNKITWNIMPKDYMQVKQHGNARDLLLQVLFLKMTDCSLENGRWSQGCSLASRLLAQHQQGPGFTPGPHKLGMEVHILSLHLMLRGRGSEVQGYPKLKKNRKK